MQIRYERSQSSFMQLLNMTMTVATALSAISLLIDIIGLDLGVGVAKGFHVLNWAIVAIFTVESFVKWGFQRFRISYLRRNLPDFGLIFLLLILIIFILRHAFTTTHNGWSSSPFSLSVVRAYILIARLYIVGSPLFISVEARRKIAKTDLAPAQLLVLSFLFLILMGTGLLLIPEAINLPEGISNIDALFTATAATCGTGLKVVDIGSSFSRFGQLIILSLIQLGGLGLMAVTTYFALMLAGDISARDSLYMSNLFNFKPLSRVWNLIITILIFTFVFEALGAVLLHNSWSYRVAFEHGTVSYYSIFHSVSAFCNSGLTLFGDSFGDFKGNLTFNITITTLVIFGGIGFIVIVNIIRFWIPGKGKLMFHSKIVLRMTVALILGGMFMILITEWNNGLYDLPLSEKFLTAYFQSVTSRTAGFSTIDIASFTYGSLFLIMILMFIGASPGGTGGGTKTSTLGILIASIWSMLRGRNSIEIFRRDISSDTVNSALLLIILTLMFLSVFGFVMLFTQTGNPVYILFELFSAFGNVGLSTGITPNLTVFGKLVLIITMFVGRVGPLTLAFAVSRIRQSHAKIAYEYPDESVMIG